MPILSWQFAYLVHPTVRVPEVLNFLTYSHSIWFLTLSADLNFGYKFEIILWKWYKVIVLKSFPSYDFEYAVIYFIHLILKVIKRLPKLNSQRTRCQTCSWTCCNSSFMTIMISCLLSLYWHLPPRSMANSPTGRQNAGNIVLLVLST